MKSGFFLSTDPELSTEILRFFRHLGADISEDEQYMWWVDPQGRAIAVDADFPEHFAPEYEEPVVSPDGAPCATAGVTGCYFECRSEELVAEVVARLAQSRKDPYWVLDSNGVAWPALAVDVSRIVL
jgi:hypothetical protein